MVGKNCLVVSLNPTKNDNSPMKHNWRPINFQNVNNFFTPAFLCREFAQTGILVDFWVSDRKERAL